MAADERTYIRDSVTYRAMSLEVRVARTLDSFGWQTAHSAWYRDVREQKDRELDVDAVRRWQYPHGNEVYVHLHVLVECKSVKGGHLLFARDASKGEDSLRYHWLDADDEWTREQLLQTLTRRGVNDRAAARAIRRFHEAMYPEGEGIAVRVVPPASPAPNRVTAGQELGSRHYLWEASQAVYGTIENTIAELLSDSLVEVRDSVPHRVGEQRLLEECVAAMVSEAGGITIFHPVVVTDAKLWAFEAGADPEPIDSCRVTQRRIATGAQRWIDIVHEDDFGRWAGRMTQWYADAFV